MGTFTEHLCWGWRGRMWPLPSIPHYNPPVDLGISFSIQPNVEGEA